MNHRRDDERFADWVDDRLDPEERAQFEAELAADPELRAGAEEYRQTVAALRRSLAVGSKPSAGFADRVLGRIAEETATPASVAPLPSLRRHRFVAWFGSAAAAAVLVSAFFVVRSFGRDPEHQVESTATAVTGWSAREFRPVDSSDEASTGAALRSEGLFGAAPADPMPVDEPSRAEPSVARRMVSPPGVLERGARGRDPAGTENGIATGGGVAADSKAAEAVPRVGEQKDGQLREQPSASPSAEVFFLGAGSPGAAGNEGEDAEHRMLQLEAANGALSTALRGDVAPRMRGFDFALPIDTLVYVVQLPDVAVIEKLQRVEPDASVELRARTRERLGDTEVAGSALTTVAWGEVAQRFVRDSLAQDARGTVRFELLATAGGPGTGTSLSAQSAVRDSDDVATREPQPTDSPVKEVDIPRPGGGGGGRGAGDARGPAPVAKRGAPVATPDVATARGAPAGPSSPGPGGAGPATPGAASAPAGRPSAPAPTGPSTPGPGGPSNANPGGEPAAGRAESTAPVVSSHVTSPNSATPGAYVPQPDDVVLRLVGDEALRADSLRLLMDAVRSAGGVANVQRTLAAFERVGPVLPADGASLQGGVPGLADVVVVVRRLVAVPAEERGR